MINLTEHIQPAAHLTLKAITSGYSLITCLKPTPGDALYGNIG
jgi:hypothetical protein